MKLRTAKTLTERCLIDHINVSIYKPQTIIKYFNKPHKNINKEFKANHPN